MVCTGLSLIQTLEILYPVPLPGNGVTLKSKLLGSSI